LKRKKKNCWYGQVYICHIYFGVITIIPFDNLYRWAYFVMHTVKGRLQVLWIVCWSRETVREVVGCSTWNVIKQNKKCVHHKIRPSI
jgi:hypothetical protein